MPSAAGLLAVAVVAAAGGVDHPIFYPQIHLTGDDPRILGAPDLNADGAPDLVTLDEDDGTITALLGDGAGNFPIRVQSDSHGERWAVLAELTGDGVLDVATLDGVGEVSVLAGDGAGRFERVAEIETGAPADRLTAGDVDGDGITDVIVTDAFSIPLVIRGLGGGAFGAPTTINAIAKSLEVHVALVNDDTMPDLISLNDIDGLVEVYLGVGGGSFVAGGAHDPELPEEPTGLALADLDGDGDLDLVVGEGLCQLDGALLAVMLGDGMGGFGPPSHYPGAGSTDLLIVRDIDRDGALDIAASGCGGFRILLGAGDGTFTPADDGFVTFLDDAVALADFDGDGLDELARRHVHGVSILDGPGDGTFLPEYVIRTDRDSDPDNALITDMNADGVPDVVSIGHSIYEVYLGDGHGAYTYLNEFVNFFDDDPAFAIARFDADQIPDAAATRFGEAPNEEIRCLLRDGVGGLQYAPSGTPVGEETGPVVAGDFNGDGLKDVVIINGQAGTFDQLGQIGVLLGRGDGTFDPVVWFEDEFAPPIRVVHDVNADGADDLLVGRAEADGQFALLFGFDGVEFEFQDIDYPTGFGDVLAFDAADLNADGAVDVVFSLEDSRALYYRLGASDDGYMHFSELSKLALEGDGGPDALLLNDVDADDAIDVVMSRDGMIEVLRGDGAGYFTHAGYYPGTERRSGPGLRGIGVGDLDGDGLEELAIGAFFSHLRLLRNISATSAPCPADFTGDGLLDYSDVLAFIVAFATGDPGADLAEPFGSFNFLDVFVFLGEFASGCP
ncbi:MAG: VCBS repeat-containing protein [Phycisphaerales bacterium]